MTGEQSKERLQEEEKVIEFINKLVKSNKPVFSDSGQVKYFVNRVSITIARLMSGYDNDNKKFIYLTVLTKDGEVSNEISMNVKEDKIKGVIDILNTNQNKGIFDVQKDFMKALA